ncbi:MAG: hypothetical protein K6G81_04580 [Lachnospiraceae bacterium]|nr:hypothetical protein [Lachnospiraceae bacterium]
MNDQNSVQSVLEQRMAEEDTAAPTEKPEDAEEQSMPDVVQDISGNISEVPSDTQVTPVQTYADPVQDGNIDVDLTVLSATMVYSEVYDMMMYPEKYIGKKVRMSGPYAVYYDESTGKYYHACIISDATACCSQGIEFELTEDYKYPDNYPETGNEICVTGTFDTYLEGDYEYCTLRAARLEKTGDNKP